MKTPDDGSASERDWSGPRPLVSGIPVAFLVGLAIVVIAILAVSLPRDLSVPAQISAQYMDVMAKSISPTIETSDPSDLARVLGQSGLGFSPRVGNLEPEFTLVGGTVHHLSDRVSALWIYRDRRLETIVAEAFSGTLDDLGPADEVRDERGQRLHIFRKTTQTLIFWQHGSHVYAVTATLPGERTVALARRLAVTSEAPVPPSPESAAP